MPAAQHYWSQEPGSHADRTLAEAAEAERRQRREAYRRASDQYDGHHKKHLKVREGGVDPNVIVNLDGEAIDQIIAMACPAMPTIEITEAAETDAERWIAAAWDANGGASLIRDFLLYGCLTGHVYARVVPTAPPGSQPDAEHSKLPHILPHILPLNPANVITFWRADDVREVLWYELMVTTDRRYRIDFLNLGAFEGAGWQVRTYTLSGNRWAPLASEDWPYTLGPIVDWQHLRDPRRYYGRSHLLASGLNDSLNKVASDVKQILRYHAAPRTIGKGVQAKDIEATSIESFFTVPKEADVFNLEMQTDLVSSLRFYELLREAHAAEMRVARLTGGPEAFRNITNLGLKVAFMNMLAQNEQLHRSYERGVIALTRRLLMLAGLPARVPLRVQWPRPLPISEAEETHIVQSQMDLGLLSPQSAAARLGLSWEVEQARMHLTP
jgi:hypothetical protein